VSIRSAGGPDEFDSRPGRRATPSRRHSAGRCTDPRSCAPTDRFGRSRGCRAGAAQVGTMASKPSGRYLRAGGARRVPGSSPRSALSAAHHIHDCQGRLLPDVVRDEHHVRFMVPPAPRARPEHLLVSASSARGSSQHQRRSTASARARLVRCAFPGDLVRECEANPVQADEIVIWSARNGDLTALSSRLSSSRRTRFA